MFHPEDLALDDDGLSPVQHAVEDGRSHAGIVVEDFRPALERLVGRDDDGAAFIALANDLEEQVGGDLVEREIPELDELCSAKHNISRGSRH
jgi:hypothetical protein